MGSRPAETWGPGASAAPARHLVVLNDERDLLALFRDLFEEEGYRVSTDLAILGPEAVAGLGPDLVVLDLVHGGEPRGLDLLRGLRARSATAAVPVVLCSAAHDRVRGLGADVLDPGVALVPKPFDIDDLLAAVAGLLAGAAGSTVPTTGRSGADGAREADA